MFGIGSNTVTGLESRIAVPNTSVVLNNYTVTGEIDRLYVQRKAGGSLQFASGYEGTAGAGQPAGV